MFFSGNESNPCGLFTFGHLALVLICFAAIIVLLFLTRKLSSKKINLIIKIIAITVTVLEIIKIIFNIVVGRSSKLDNILPLYFCSLFLFASLIFSFSKGKVKFVAASFLFYGGLVGGSGFLLYPSTSLLLFPLWHFLTVHSMIYHTLMIFVAIVIVRKDLFTPKRNYFLSYFLFTTIFCLLALFINLIFKGNNLMLISRPINGTILEVIWNFSNIFYTPLIIIIQNAGSFILAQAIYEVINIKRKNG